MLYLDIALTLVAAFVSGWIGFRLLRSEWIKEDSARIRQYRYAAGMMHLLGVFLVVGVLFIFGEENREVAWLPFLALGSIVLFGGVPFGITWWSFHLERSTGKG